LTSTAKAEWRRVVKDLAALDMLRSVDTAALSAYCQSYARWRSAEEIITADGQTWKEPIIVAGVVVGHKVKRHPATSIAKEAMTGMLRASSLFGFDPSSRSRINLGEAAAVDPFVEFMADLGAEDE
jgi:P27 family predicted phage terminase small subunit